MSNTWGLNFPDQLLKDKWVALKSPVRTWPTWIRRSYILTWPIAMPCRWMLFVLLTISGVLLLGLSLLAHVIYSAWHGIPTAWNE